MRKRIAAAIAGAAMLAGAGEANPFAKADALREDGHFAEAFELYRGGLADPASKASDAECAGALHAGVDCLDRLGRIRELDGFLDAATAQHAKSVRVLCAAAERLDGDTHHGSLVDGQFERGSWGAARAMNVERRDHSRALRLLAAALPVAEEADGAARALLYSTLADVLMPADASWRLLAKTALEGELPEPEDGWGQYEEPGGAPVSETGDPIFHREPESWAAAKDDGERWRWALARLAEADANDARQRLMRFSMDQFGVQTLRDLDPEALELDTLADDETFARLANGPRRFKMPDDFNYIALAKAMGDSGALGRIYLDRLQYAKAADAFRAAGDQKAVDEIVQPRVRMPDTRTQPASRQRGEGAPPPPEFDIVFRNATNAHIALLPVDMDGVVREMQEFLRDNPRRIDWWRTSPENLVGLFTAGNGAKFLGRPVAEWTAALEPRQGHRDRLVTLSAPEPADPGVYLVKVKVDGGNEARAFLRMPGIAIAMRQPHDAAGGTGQVAVVADATTGRPLEGASLECFLWCSRSDGTNFATRTRSHAFRTDASGMVALPSSLASDFRGEGGWTWPRNILIARTADGDLELFGGATGWIHPWFGRPAYAPEMEPKAFLMTDRPVYRPGSTVQYKIWITRAVYGAATNSPWAGQSVGVYVYNPKGEKAWATNIVADSLGGVAGAYALPEGATLGPYRVRVQAGGRPVHAGSFRVEEYRKPEFEVAVETPGRPVELGGKVKATVRATYTFGAPVSRGLAKITVTRREKSASWWPAARWDWLFGLGYCWYFYDYDWYPGWNRWGTCRPRRGDDWGFRRDAPPDVVLRATAPLKADGTAEVEWDTALARKLYGDADQSYEITAEVADESRRVESGSGAVTVAAEPFRVFAWADRAAVRVGDAVRLTARAADADGRPVAVARREAELFRVVRGEGGVLREESVRKWGDADASPAGDGSVSWALSASRRGQYRWVCRMADAEGRVREGAQVFAVMGERDDGRDYRFAALELVPDKAEYAPGDVARLSIRTEAADSHVLLCLRPGHDFSTNGAPRWVRTDGKVAEVEIPVGKGDQPNFFVEALTIRDGRLHSEVREIAVPPASKVCSVEVEARDPAAGAEAGGAPCRVLPGGRAEVSVRVLDAEGRPCDAAATLTVYDKSVDLFAGGSNVPDIRKTFWGWRRSWGRGRTPCTLDRDGKSFLYEGETAAGPLGLFGWIDAAFGELRAATRRPNQMAEAAGGLKKCAAPPVCFAASPDESRLADAETHAEAPEDGAGGGGAPEGAVRKAFADTAYWNPLLEKTDEPGVYRASFEMPEDITGWRARAWAMAPGVRVGEGEAPLATRKPLFLRMQAPRFLTEKDEVVLSANVHNDLGETREVAVALVCTGAQVRVESLPRAIVEIPAGGSARVDWRVEALAPGALAVRMTAVSGDAADGVERTLPVQVHGILKTESWSRAIRPEDTSAEIGIRVPAERDAASTRLEIRWSPSLAAAMLDAIPYLASYPYGCTEQTLNRFLPAAVARRALAESGLDLAALKGRATNLNPQEIGDDAGRLAQWGRGGFAPVFDDAEFSKIVAAGVTRLGQMQLSDGGWGWFSGYGEQSWPHTTATVLRGLRTAKDAGVDVPPDMLARGARWLQGSQADRLRWLQEDRPRRKADAQDAFTAYALALEGFSSPAMLDILYADRNGLPFYAKALLGLAFDALRDDGRRDMLARNMRQALREDPENQSAWFDLGGACRWRWYGDDIETQAYGLKLLLKTEPDGPAAAGLVKYLLNNRRHATYWRSTRDTALALEALSEYYAKVDAKAARLGGDGPVEVEVALDGKVVKTARVPRDAFPGFDNAFAVEGAALSEGGHTVAVTRRGGGPLYVAAYLTNFTKEDPIAAAGLEVKVRRTVCRLVEKDVSEAGRGALGQPVGRRRPGCEAVELKDGDAVASGDLLEVRLDIESKNEYEYMLFEDRKAAGCEAVGALSGYARADGLWAYVEYRDSHVALFVRELPRGKSMLAYRLRAEAPGVFHALPATGRGMYAPELRANSDELRLRIEDR